MQAVEEEGEELLRVVLIDAVKSWRKLDDGFLSRGEQGSAASTRRAEAKLRLTRNDNG